VIDQLELQDFSGFEDATDDPQISFRWGWIATYAARGIPPR
jgi:hypothetical protein